MEYPEKVYVSVQQEPFDQDGVYYRCVPKIDEAGDYMREVEVAVYQLVGKVKLVNKTVLAEPDAGTP